MVEIHGRLHLYQPDPSSPLADYEPRLAQGAMAPRLDRTVESPSRQPLVYSVASRRYRSVRLTLIMPPFVNRHTSLVRPV